MQMIGDLYFKTGHYYSLALLCDFKKDQSFHMAWNGEGTDTLIRTNLATFTGRHGAAAMTPSPLEGCHPGMV